MFLAKIRTAARELLTLDEKDPRRLFQGLLLFINYLVLGNYFKKYLFCPVSGQGEAFLAFTLIRGAKVTGLDVIVSTVSVHAFKPHIVTSLLFKVTKFHVFIYLMLYT